LVLNMPAGIVFMAWAPFRTIVIIPWSYLRAGAILGWLES